MNTTATSPGRGLIDDTLVVCNDCLNREDFAGARKALCQALAMEPGRADLWSYRGCLDLLTGDRDSAGRDLAEALRLDANCSTAWSGMARYHFQQGDLNAAEAAADRALATDVADTDAARVKAEIQLKRGVDVSLASDNDAGWNPLVLVHIPKTGGNSIRVAVEQALPPESIIRVYRGAMRRSEALALLQGHVGAKGTGQHKLPSFIMGHFGIDFVQLAGLRKARVFTMLRDPYERAVSLWRHEIRNYPRSLFGEQARKMSLVEFFEARLSPMFENSQARQLVGGLEQEYHWKLTTHDDNLLECTKSKLQSDFSFVGFTEDLPTALAWVGSRIGVPSLQTVRANVDGEPKDAFLKDPANRKVIERFFATDIALYEWALKNCRDEQGTRHVAAGSNRHVSFTPGVQESTQSLNGDCSHPATGGETISHGPKAWQPQTKFDVLVCGLPIERLDPERPYGSLRGNATRAFGLANNLALQGWRTGLVVEPGCEAVPSRWISRDLELVPRPNLTVAAGNAQVLLLCSTNLKTLRQRVPEVFSVVHPRKWVASCFDSNQAEDLPALLQGVVGVSLNNDVVAKGWEKHGLDLPLHVIPYGVDEHPYIDESIVPVERPTAIWIGALRLPSTLQQIVRFAEVNPECEVRVVSAIVRDQSLASADGTMIEPYIDHRGGPVPTEQFAAVLKRWCGRDQPANLQYLGSCLGENAPLLGAASMALGFSRRFGQTHDDSKLLDYLRSGLPVLADDGQPSCRFIRETGHGLVIPFGADDATLRQGYLHCLALSDVERRRQMAAMIRQQYGWPAVARKTKAWIQEDVEAAREKARLRLLSQLNDWPELRRECAVFYYKPEALTMPRFERTHVIEVVQRARQKHPDARRFYLTDTTIRLDETEATFIGDAKEAAALPGAKVFICAFFSDERLAHALATIQFMPDAVYLMPRVFYPTARYFHHNVAAHEVLCAEAALSQPKFSVADFENLIQALESTRQVPGDFIEVGVFQGRSAHCVLSYMRRAGIRRRAWLLDVFEGFTYPEALASRDAYWAGSHANAGEETVRQWTAEFTNATVLKSNIITDPLPADLKSVAVANIDVDMYEAVVASLKQIVPLTVPGSIIVLEDQGHTPPLGGAWLAVKEFLDSPTAGDFTPVHLGSGQMYLVRH